jgi:hypothetical protein
VERTGAETWATYHLTSAGKALLDDADHAAQRTTLGLGLLATLDTVTGAQITNGSITNDDLSATAEIDQSKIANLSTDLAAKEPSITAGANSQYFRGDKTWQTLNTSAVAEGTNLYYTDSRARLASSAIAPLSYDSSTGVMSITQASTGVNGFLSSADFNSFNNKQAAITTSTALNAGTMTSALQNGFELNPYGPAAGNTGELRFEELTANGNNFVGFKAPDSLSGNVIWTLPSVMGSSGQVLSAGAGGVLSWITIPSAPIISVAGRTGAVTLANTDISGLGSLATINAVAGGLGGTIIDGTISNNDISSSAAIDQSKIANLSTDLAAKEPSITAGANSQYFRGDKTWQTLNTSAVAEGTNLYYTDSRARLASSATAPLSYNSSTGVMSIIQASTGVNGFLSSADFNSFNNKQAAITTSTALNAGTVTSALQNGFELNPYGPAAGNTGELRFEELTANGNNFVGFKAPDSLSGNVIWTLPSVMGSSGQVLSAGAGGVLSWITPTSAAVTTVAGRTGAVTLSHADIIGLGTLATASVVSGGAGGTITDATVTNDDISSTAAIADTKLATIASAGKVANSATTATNTNTAGAIVARDAAGNFSAGTITATLNGNAANVTGTVALTNGGTGANLSSTGGAGQYLQQSTVGGPVIVGIIASGDVPWASPGAIGVTTANSAVFTTLTTSGNVGIGTISPNSPLQVNGTIHATAGGIKFPNNTVQTTAAKVVTYSGTFNGVGQVDIEEPFGKGHKSLEIKFLSVIFSVDGGTPEVRIKNGGAYQTGALYDWHYVFTRWGWGPGRFGQQSDTKIGIMTETATPSDRVGNTPGENLKAKFDISWPDASSNQKIISWDAFWHCADAAKVLCDSRGQGVYTGNTNAIEGFRLFVSSGTISGSWLVTAYD